MPSYFPEVPGGGEVDPLLDARCRTGYAPSGDLSWDGRRADESFGLRLLLSHGRQSLVTSGGPAGERNRAGQCRGQAAEAQAQAMTPATTSAAPGASGA